MLRERRLPNSPVKGVAADERGRVDWLTWFRFARALSRRAPSVAFGATERQNARRALMNEELGKAVARYALGSIPPDDLPDVARAALRAGVDSQNFDVLAAAIPAWDSSELCKLFEAGLAELKVSRTAEP